VRNRLSLVAALVASAAASVVALALGEPIARAALPMCPTQSQLERHGATGGEVTSGPQMSTGEFPLTATLRVPDKQCSYQGTLSLLLVYWQLSTSAEGAAKAHFAYECKLKSCTVFLTKGVNSVVVSSPGKKTKITSEPTLVETVIGGSVNGEATVSNPPSSAEDCDQLARALYSFLAGRGPFASGDILEQFGCP